MRRRCRWPPTSILPPAERQPGGVTPASSAIRAGDYPYEELQGLPILFVNGDLDPEVKGGTHPTAVEIAMPRIFEPFNRHERK